MEVHYFRLIFNSFIHIPDREFCNIYPKNIIDPSTYISASSETSTSHFHEPPLEILCFPDLCGSEKCKRRKKCLLCGLPVMVNILVVDVGLISRLESFSIRHNQDDQGPNVALIVSYNEYKYLVIV